MTTQYFWTLFYVLPQLIRPKDCHVCITDGRKVSGTKAVGCSGKISIPSFTETLEFPQNLFGAAGHTQTYAHSDILFMKITIRDYKYFM
jgi:hypothetical protein